MAAAFKHDGIEAWYMDESMEDHRLPHHRKLKLFVSSDQLKDLGVLSWQLNKEEDKFDDDLKLFCESKGYSNQFLIELSPEKLPNYEVLIEKFYVEHLHTVEEVHYIVEGSGYFDVRDESDSWIRIAAKKGSIISLPAVEFITAFLLTQRIT
ncbi:1,2-dihydroxy-3-keto-5-methylthiopentene dioxygenase 2 [Apostasia shenzhenica]|uniref:acireductone dioxygenase (Fe(2+)-requiring) n=1 Tax=Apostasia shenzhenica TaxID=1088818 RepID=A0A2I0A1G0_9ASPA|nr:1,2-dihydroxy-3-keto-5-methylthiopentene dioxygenase 2 [Apostasia shenzhenica]